MRDLRQRLMAIAKNSEAKRPESPPEVKTPIRRIKEYASL